MSWGNRADEQWAALAALDEGERRARMAAVYQELASLTEDERRTRMAAMAVAEFALPEEKAREMALSRVCVWTSMDQATATMLLASFEWVMDHGSAQDAMRRIAIVQSLAKTLSAQDAERLRVLVPKAFPEKLKAHGAVKRKRLWEFWKAG